MRVHNNEKDFYSEVLIFFCDAIFSLCSPISNLEGRQFSNTELLMPFFSSRADNLPKTVYHLILLKLPQHHSSSALYKVNGVGWAGYRLGGVWNQILKKRGHFCWYSTGKPVVPKGFWFEEPIERGFIDPSGYALPSWIFWEFTFPK